MTTIGTPFTTSATKIMLLGAGELGKEFAIEALRLGIEVMAVDRYADAPAMQVAQRCAVIDMLNGDALEALIRQYNPTFIVPEVEAIATARLIKLEQAGFNVVPSAKATQLTMDREGIRRLVAEELGLQTSTYGFVDNQAGLEKVILQLGFPCVIKPVMSSSGKGQSVIGDATEITHAWEYAQQGSRSGAGRVIVESFIDFDYEITLLTIRHRNGTYFCQPIGHRQEEGDYQESWQPQSMSSVALQQAQEMAKQVTDALGGYGLFGVEFFVKGDQVYFSELSPRPHDTGMVTLISQNLSEFALHLRAILNLPIPDIVQYGAAASHALLVKAEHAHDITYANLDQALQHPSTNLRLFGKPEVRNKRRMGVALALGTSIEQARDKAKTMIESIKVTVNS